MGKSESPEQGPPALSERGARDLLNHIIEYLQYLQYHQTVQTLLSERATKRSQLNNSLMSARTQNKDARERLRAEMMRKFDEGRRDDFFTLWQQYVPASMLGLDFATQKMEFYLQVYFAIYPVLPSSSVLVVTPGGGPGPRGNSPHSSSSRHELALRMKAFKSYLEGRGAALALTAEFLPYYALPFIQQPEHHPSFEPLFQSRWVDEERLRLKTFLEGLTSRGSVPALYVMYCEHLQATDGVPRLSPRGRALRASSRAHPPSREAATRGSGGIPPVPYHQQMPGGFRASGAAAGSGGGSILQQHSPPHPHPQPNGEGPGARRAFPGPLPPRASFRQVSASGSGASSGPGSAAVSEVGLERQSGLGGPALAAPLRAAPPHGVGGGGFGYRGGDDDLQGRLHSEAEPGRSRRRGGGIGGGGNGEYSDDGLVRDDEEDKAKAVPRQGRGGVYGSAYTEDVEDFDEADEQEIADALRSPNSADLPPGRGFPAPATGAAGAPDASVALSLEQLGMAEGAILRESVQLLGSTMGGTMGGAGGGGSGSGRGARSAAELVAAGGAAAAVDGGEDGLSRLSSATALAPLDYRRLKRDLQGPDTGLAARLIQALRWRLTRSSPGADRWGLIASWIEVDLLDCHTPLVRQTPLPAPQSQGPRARGAAAAGATRSRPQTAAAAAAPTSLLQVLAGSTDPRIAEEAARLANAVASDRLGRNYLMLPSGGAVSALMGVLRRYAPPLPAASPAAATAAAAGSAAAGSATGGGSTGASEAAERKAQTDVEGGGGSGGALEGAAPVRDGPAAQQALIALQKLSLKRAAQSQMVREGAVQWVVEFLQDLTTVSPTAIEYGTALLMNLCLRSSGRVAAASCAAPLLRLCESLLNCSNDQVHTYINGTLYSVFSRAAMREAAMARRTPELLEEVAQSGRPPFSAQCQYILRQLYMPDLSDPELDASEDDAAPDGDADSDPGGEEGADEAYADVDITPESLTRAQDEPCGEELLCGSGYLASSKAAREHLVAVRSSVAAAAAAMAAVGVSSLRGSVLLGTLPQQFQQGQQQLQQGQQQGDATGAASLSTSASRALGAPVAASTTIELGASALEEDEKMEGEREEEGSEGEEGEEEKEEGSVAEEEVGARAAVLPTLEEGGEEEEEVAEAVVAEATGRVVQGLAAEEEEGEQKAGAREEEEAPAAAAEAEEGEAAEVMDDGEEEAIAAAAAAVAAAAASEPSGEGSDDEREADGDGDGPVTSSNAPPPPLPLDAIAEDACPSPVPFTARRSRKAAPLGPEDASLAASATAGGGGGGFAASRASAGSRRPSSAYVALATSTASTSILAAARALEAARLSGTAGGMSGSSSMRRRSYIKPVTPTSLARGLQPPWGATGISESGEEDGGGGDGADAVRTSAAGAAAAVAASVTAADGEAAPWDSVVSARTGVVRTSTQSVADAEGATVAAPAPVPTRRRQWELPEDDDVIRGSVAVGAVMASEAIADSQPAPTAAEATAAASLSGSPAPPRPQSRGLAASLGQPPRPPTGPHPDGSLEAPPGPLMASTASLSARPPSRPHSPFPPTETRSSYGRRASESGQQAVPVGVGAVSGTAPAGPSDGGGGPGTPLSARLRRTASASGLAVTAASAVAGDSDGPSDGRDGDAFAAPSGLGPGDGDDSSARPSTAAALKDAYREGAADGSRSLGEASLPAAALRRSESGGGEGQPRAAASSRPSTAAPASRPGSAAPPRSDLRGGAAPDASLASLAASASSPPLLRRSSRPASPSLPPRRQSVADGGDGSSDGSLAGGISPHGVGPSSVVSFARSSAAGGSPESYAGAAVPQADSDTTVGDSGGSGPQPSQNLHTGQARASRKGASLTASSSGLGVAPEHATLTPAAPAPATATVPAPTPAAVPSSRRAGAPGVHASSRPPASGPSGAGPNQNQQHHHAPIARQVSGSPGPEQRGRGIPRPPAPEGHGAAALGAGLQGTSYRTAPVPPAAPAAGGDASVAGTTTRHPTPPGRAAHRTRMGPPPSGPVPAAGSTAASPPRVAGPGRSDAQGETRRQLSRKPSGGRA